MGVGVKVLFGILFALFALSIMFADALVHVDLNSKPSMALTHGAHGSSGSADTSTGDMAATTGGHGGH